MRRESVVERRSSTHRNVFRHHSFAGSGPERAIYSPIKKLQRNSSSFSFKDRERQDQLTELLGRYSAHGLPPLPELLALGRPKLDDASLMILDLEPHWHSLVDNSANMTKKQQEHQEAVWELLQTEVSYIKQIRVIIDVFQNCLINVQQEGFLNEIETERLFSNIDKIFECNCLFWQEYLVPVLTKSRETHQRLDPLLAREGFVDHFPILFQVYFKYFIEHKSCMEYAKSRMENSDLFKTFISWAEAQKQCNRLKLADILVKPMQRLLKYSLLLQAILKHTESEHDTVAIREMIESVEKLCWAANTSLKRREDYEKLEAVRKTIDLYDAIEAPNDECAKIIQEYNGNFNLLAPMPGFREGQPRSLLSHSSLRMKEAQAAKLDVDCLLFTDLILICKSNKKMDRFKIIRPPMRLDQLVVSELRDKGSFLLIYMNEYHVPISAFTFHSDVAGIRAWLERFRDAQKDYKLKKIQESAELERIRSGGTIEEVHYTPIISVPSDLDLTSGTGFPRSESMESADRFMPNLLLSPQGEEGFGKFPTDIGRSGSTGDIYGQQFAQIPSASSIGGSNLTTPATIGNSSSLSSSSSSLPHSSISNGVNTDSSPVVSSRPPPVPGVVDRTLPTAGSVTGSLVPAQLQGGVPGSSSTFHKPIQPCRSVPNIQVGNEVVTSTATSLPQDGLSANRTHNSSVPSASSSSSPSVPHRTIINVNTSKDGSSSFQYGLQQQQQQQQQQTVYSKQYPQHSGYDSSFSSLASSVFSSTNAADQSSPANIDISVSQVSLGSSAGGDQGSVFDEDELSRINLATRRTSRAGKRYHTADSITDMKTCQEKDASIHKRLSWRTDVQVVDNKNLGSPNKALSTDSVRSYPSSSGVSSTGSLHLNSDISEESEVSGFGGSSEGGVVSPTRGKNMFTLGDSADPHLQVADNVDSNFDDATNNNNINNINHSSRDPGTAGEYLEVEDDEYSTSDPSQSRSKSTPDLVTMFNNSLQVSEMEDGIASVAVSSEGFNRKLTHADILKMKKLKHQVLYDANVESS
ncbi:pleckstrin homology domain-containing family G member 5-like [Elysia marginata]|uniref:Pleckstrin homology domain-containing family G member 5-like n=1 Tax=Elysia marginata TaxID=1093978 RepID=A0AAV4ITN9_9GAST|nr:pleckstrin homology domain-containing family G member 5-like [Elysia marginata]